MYRIYLILYIVSIIVFDYLAAQDNFRQERAKLKYFNPKFIKDVTIFTRRKSRHDPYLTNMTAITLMPYGNNVSYANTLTLGSGGDFRIVSKVCDTLNVKWIRDFMSRFSNIGLSHCPFPAGKYVYTNMELPPKNMPIPIDGDCIIKFELFVTATKEPILELTTALRYDQNARKSKGKKG